MMRPVLQRAATRQGKSGITKIAVYRELHHIKTTNYEKDEHYVQSIDCSCIIGDGRNALCTGMVHLPDRTAIPGGIVDADLAE